MPGFTDSHGTDQWFEQFVEPGGPAAFFKNDMCDAAQPAKVIVAVFGFGFDFNQAFNLAILSSRQSRSRICGHPCLRT